MSTDRYVDKQNVIYTYNRLLFSLSKEGNSNHATTWTYLGSIKLNDISQTHNDQYMWLH